MTGRRFPNGQVKVPAQKPGEEVDVLTELLSTSSPGWYRYQLGGEVKLLAGLVQVSARWGGHPMDEADTGHPGHPVDDRVYDQYK
ncbi:hypothetical protein PCANC_08896 [Puccinia coronata f. sp. avenae]|uniref:Uncharacterized protein n=1 Tax=Puccinia coronata f. sp. avenae TaxID=200324 RepID=A0A2N5U1H1_9BASI|nr:hypothetical protein PCASD_19346 [Puccinia coronata f. sp. avenae]PLW52795.1 hypothetical protein PCANC_08896 [Puccinia coronata f. sp. avenae]